MKNLVLTFFFIALFIFCSNKNVKPFTQINQRVEFDYSNSDEHYLDTSYVDTSGKFINELISPLIDSLPTYDSMPFSLKIGEQFIDSKNKIIQLGLSPVSSIDYQNKKYLKVISSITTNKNLSFYYYTRNENKILIESDIYFENERLSEIKQKIHIPDITLKAIKNKLAQDGFNKATLKSKIYEISKYEFDILNSSFLELYKNKYGEENYNFVLKYFDKDNNGIRYRDIGYMWYKDGVLVNYRVYSPEYDLYVSLVNENINEFNKLYFVEIEYSSAKTYLKNYPYPQPRMLIDTPIDIPSKKIIIKKINSGL